MANIDDFFAKKDKKKKGSKGAKGFSKANTDVIAKNLIKTDEKEVKEADKEMVAQLSEEKPVTANTGEDEEWGDYFENKKDFTGLKIENLVIEEKVAEEEEEETEINEDGEVVTKPKDKSGPWSKITSSQQQQEKEEQEAQQKQQDTPPEPESALPNVVGGAYVPPNRRGAGAAEAAPRAQQARPQPRRNRNAPDITSEVFFPSLSAAGDDSGPKGAWGNRAAAKRDEGAFQEVMERSNQGYVSRQSDAPRLVTTNKFDALRE